MASPGENRDHTIGADWSGAIVESAAEAVISCDLSGVITLCNPAAGRMYGYETCDVVGRHASVILPPALYERVEQILATDTAGAPVARFETFLTRNHGIDIPVSVTVRLLFDVAGRPIGVCITTHEAWDKVQVERADEDASLRLQAAFHRSEFGVVLASIDGCATAVNPATCEMLGRPSVELIGNNWSRFTHPEDRNIAEAALAGFRQGKESIGFECRFCRPDGRLVWVMNSTTLVRDSADRPSFFITQLHDITDRKKAELDLEYRALHDHLTGLPARTLLHDRLEHALDASRRTGSRVCVMFLDLDGFKEINDSYGHATGDQVLIEVARRLTSSIRPGDTAARIGGDEYVVVCQGFDADVAHVVASRIARAVQSPVRIGELELRIAVSVGVALSGPSSTAQSLLEDADLDMYTAKKERGTG